MRKGVSGRMLKWLNAFLQDRSFVVRVGGSLSKVFSLENGIPQGSVLSPLPFAIMIDDLPSQLSSSHGLFADDCANWIDGLNRNRTFWRRRFGAGLFGARTFGRRTLWRQDIWAPENWARECKEQDHEIIDYLHEIFQRLCVRPALRRRNLQ